MIKKLFIFLLIFVSLSKINAQNILLFDNFDSYDDFIIDSIGNWTMIDNDNSVTYSISKHSFTNEAYVGSYIIFNQNSVNPALQNWDAHSNNKFLACFSAVDPPNDDWIISDTFVAGNIDTVIFWVKSISSQFSLERFNVYLMTDTLENSIVEKLNSGLNYDEAPSEWTKVAFPINNYAGDTLRIGIQCVSDDSYCLQIDDFSVRGKKFGETKINEINKKTLIFPNPTKGIVHINSKFDKLEVFDFTGKFLFSNKNQQIDLSDYQKGIYLLKIISGGNIFSQKIVLE